MTPVDEFWTVIQRVLPSDRWVKLADLLRRIEPAVQLDDEDRQPSSTKQASDLRWQRNVRNALQSHLGDGVERNRRGYYRLIAPHGGRGRISPIDESASDEPGLGASAGGTDGGRLRANEALPDALDA